MTLVCISALRCRGIPLTMPHSYLSPFCSWATRSRSSGNGSSLSMSRWLLPRCTAVSRAVSDHFVLVNSLMAKHICCFVSVYGGASDAMSSRLIASATVLCTPLMYTISGPNSSRRTLHCIACYDVAVEFSYPRFCGLCTPLSCGHEGLLIIPSGFLQLPVVPFW